MRISINSLRVSLRGGSINSLNWSCARLRVAREKKKMAKISFQEERRMEQESCRRHFNTWRKLWGRPGHGAPIDHAHRNNLYNILYRPAIYWISTRTRKIRTEFPTFFQARSANLAEISLRWEKELLRGGQQLAIKDNTGFSTGSTMGRQEIGSAVSPFGWMDLPLSNEIYRVLYC